VHVADAVPRTFGTAVIGRVNHAIAVVATIAASTSQDHLRGLLAAATAGPDQLFRSVTAGGMADDWIGARHSLREALDSATLAPLLGPTAPLLAEDTALMRLLHAVDDAGALDDFVARQLGAVLDRDARRGSDLLGTLVELFRAGGSRTAAAQALGIRRQTLYYRLARIEHLVGVGALSDPGRAVSLHVATLGWSIATRTARIPASSQEPPPWCGHPLASSSR